jgi:hypothetical protein
MKYLVVDRHGWPIERVTSKNRARHALWTLAYMMRCLVHGRGIVSRQVFQARQRAVEACNATA